MNFGSRITSVSYSVAVVGVLTLAVSYAISQNGKSAASNDPTVTKKAAAVKSAISRAAEAKQRAEQAAKEASRAALESRIADEDVIVAQADLRLAEAIVAHQRAIATRSKVAEGGESLPASVEQGGYVEPEPKQAKGKDDAAAAFLGKLEGEAKPVKYDPAVSAKLKLTLQGANDKVVINGSEMVTPLGTVREYSAPGFTDDKLWPYTVVVTHDGKSETRKVSMQGNKTAVEDFTK